jgi:hypothetical protein
MYTFLSFFQVELILDKEYIINILKSELSIFYSIKYLFYLIGCFKAEISGTRPHGPRLWRETR